MSPEMLPWSESRSTQNVPELTCAHVVPPAIKGMGANFEIITVVGSNMYLEPDIPLFEEKISRCMAVILCYDVSNRKSFESLGRWIDVVKTKNARMLRYLAACKCDKTPNVERREQRSLPGIIGSSSYRDLSHNKGWN